MYEFRLQVIKASVVSEVALWDEMKRSSWKAGCFSAASTRDQGRVPRPAKFVDPKDILTIG